MLEMPGIITQKEPYFSVSISNMSGKLWDKIPSFLWILIIVAGAVLFIGAALGFFWTLTHVEGVGSIIILVCGWIVFRISNNSPDLESGNLGIATVITFFALMGMALDQTGNYVYNRPLEWVFCPSQTDLVREVITRGSSRGGVTVSQNFSCVTEIGGQAVRRISDFEQVVFRFFEYVLIGYILLGFSRLYTRLKNRWKTNNA